MSEAAPELEEHFRALLDSVPEDTESRPFRFARDSISAPPEACWTTNLVVDVGTHAYGSQLEAKILGFSLGRSTCRSLGCLVAAALVHGVRVQLELRNDRRAEGRESRRAGWIVVDPGSNGAADMEILDLAFRYSPHEQPSIPSGLEEVEFAFVPARRRRRANVGNFVATDHAAIWGGPAALANLSRFLLDAGRSAAAADEFEFEHMHENVGRLGAEARFNLPESVSWSIFDLQP